MAFHTSAEERFSVAESTGRSTDVISTVNKSGIAKAVGPNQAKVGWPRGYSSLVRITPWAGVIVVYARYER